MSVAIGNKRLLAFIASPYGDGTGWENQFRNVVRADEAMREVALKGWVPLSPVKLYAYLDRDKRFKHEDFINWDNELLRRCDALVRIPGDSPGADAECALAKALGIPVYYGVSTLPNLREGASYERQRVQADNQAGRAAEEEMAANSRAG